MAEHVIRLPDVGEGVAEAELVEWHVKIGDLVRADATLAAVMTDKATVEIPSPISGEIVWLGAEVGDVVAVGSDLVRLRAPGDGKTPTAIGEQTSPQDAPAAEGTEPTLTPEPRMAGSEKRAEASPVSNTSRPAPTASRQQFLHGPPRPEGEKPIAAPAVRLRAREAGVDLRQVPGTGPAGRITHEDLDAFFSQGPTSARTPILRARTSVEAIKVTGLRRRVAEKMALSSSRIPHITYVEEVDVTGLEALREALNSRERKAQPRLTLLPFLMRAMVRAIEDQPKLNSVFDDVERVIHQHAGVNIGIATQTPAGLMVPVVRNVEALDVWGCAAEIARLAEAARAGTATREELSGSTITITSLGAMGGLVTTPIINHPEVAIIGVNKMMMRPVWDGSAFIPRKMMNLSSSFDHRVVDGWDAAMFVQRIKALLETPALIFIEG
ncbi:MAG TPA: dihydrolipoamide acetyltransferase family protein [Acetobacteraceae bacterium]|nr:dihydrolipoamide acetyltransferase family protein [Acetobacteraceae bacterium]